MSEDPNSTKTRKRLLLQKTIIFFFFSSRNLINRTESKKTKPNTLQDKMAMQAQLTERRRSNTQAQNTKIKPSRKQATTRHLPRVRSPRSMNTGQDEEPLPSTGTRGGDGTPPTAKTNHIITNLHRGSNRKAKTGGSTIRR